MADKLTPADLDEIERRIEKMPPAILAEHLLYNDAGQLRVLLAVARAGLAAEALAEAVGDVVKIWGDGLAPSGYITLKRHYESFRAATSAPPDAEVERILTMPDEQLLAEAKAEGRDIEIEGIRGRHAFLAAQVAQLREDVAEMATSLALNWQWQISDGEGAPFVVEAEGQAVSLRAIAARNAGPK
jgi:hypothetical protein